MTPVAIYLVGASGSGKSTVMAALLDQLGLVTGDWYKIWPGARCEFRGEPLEDIVTGEVRGLSLGVTRSSFSGTDAIGLAAQGEAMVWLAEAPELPPLILGEGARLGNPRFLRALSARTRLTVGYLTAPQETLDERLSERAHSMKSSFRKSTATRAANAVAGLHVVELDTSELDPSACAAVILSAARRQCWPAVVPFRSHGVQQLEQPVELHTT